MVFQLLTVVILPQFRVEWLILLKPIRRTPIADTLPGSAAQCSNWRGLKVKPQKVRDGGIRWSKKESKVVQCPPLDIPKVFETVAAIFLHNSLDKPMLFKLFVKVYSSSWLTMVVVGSR